MRLDLDRRFVELANRDLLQQRATIDSLRKYTETTQLRILVGAGLSVAAGLPAWDDLLLYLLQELHRQQTTVVLETAERANAGNGPIIAALRAYLSTARREDLVAFMHRIGREASADFVRAKISDSNNTSIDTLLSNALYGEPGSSERRGRTEKIPHAAAAVFRQIASIAWNSHPRVRLYTTNYDDQIERALQYIGGLLPRGELSEACRKIQEKFSSGDECLRHLCFTDNDLVYSDNQGFSLGSGDEVPRVRHLHGFVGPAAGDGRLVRSKDLIMLGETDYLGESAGQGPAVAEMVRMFEMATGATLVLGMSLSDPNLRRALKIARSKRSGDGDRGVSPKIYAVLKRERPGFDEWAASYYSSLLGVSVVYLSDWAVMPMFLRSIRSYRRQDGGVANQQPEPSAPYREQGQAYPNPVHWSASAAEWAKKHGIAWEENQEFPTGAPGSLVATHTVLTCARNHLRARFSVDTQEAIELELLLPALSPGSPPKLELRAIGSTSREPKDLIDCPQVLSLEPGRVQGAAGLSFQAGALLSCIGSAGGVDYNVGAVDREKLGKQAQRREFVSILAASVLDTSDWVPVCTICITSNRRVPFWLRPDISDSDRHYMEAFLRSLPAKILQVVSRTSTALSSTVTSGENRASTEISRLDGKPEDKAGDDDKSSRRRLGSTKISGWDAKPEDRGGDKNLRKKPGSAEIGPDLKSEDEAGDASL